MKDPSAIGPLIDALVTVHKFKIVKAGGDGAHQRHLRHGSRRQVGHRACRPAAARRSSAKPIPNQAVLDALVAMTGQNFNFDKQAWRYWYAAQKKPPPKLDARRG